MKIWFLFWRFGFNEYFIFILVLRFQEDLIFFILRLVKKTNGWLKSRPDCVTEMVFVHEKLIFPVIWINIQLDELKI